MSRDFSYNKLTDLFINGKLNVGGIMSASPLIYYIDVAHFFNPQQVMKIVELIYGIHSQNNLKAKFLEYWTKRSEKTIPMAMEKIILHAYTFARIGINYFKVNFSQQYGTNIGRCYAKYDRTKPLPLMYTTGSLRNFLLLHSKVVDIDLVSCHASIMYWTANVLLSDSPDRINISNKINSLGCFVKDKDDFCRSNNILPASLKKYVNTVMYGGDPIIHAKKIFGPSNCNNCAVTNITESILFAKNLITDVCGRSVAANNNKKRKISSLYDFCADKSNTKESSILHYYLTTIENHIIFSIIDFLIKKFPGFIKYSTEKNFYYLIHGYDGFTIMLGEDFEEESVSEVIASINTFLYNFTSSSYIKVTTKEISVVRGKVPEDDALFTELDELTIRSQEVESDVYQEIDQVVNQFYEVEEEDLSCDTIIPNRFKSMNHFLETMKKSVFICSRNGSLPDIFMAKYCCTKDNRSVISGYDAIDVDKFRNKFQLVDIECPDFNVIDEEDQEARDSEKDEKKSKFFLVDTFLSQKDHPCVVDTIQLPNDKRRLIPMNESTQKNLFKLNTWIPFEFEGCTLQPKLNLLKGFMILSKFLCNLNDADNDFFLSWISNIFVNPGVKCCVHVFMSGLQGCGKGIMSNIISSIIGLSRTSMIKNVERDIVGNFNGILKDKLFLIFDEFEENAWKANEGHFKHLFTENKIITNQKHQQQQSIDSFHRFLMLTNELCGIEINANERRISAINCHNFLSSHYSTKFQYYTVTELFFSQLNLLKEDPAELLGLFNYFKNKESPNFSSNRPHINLYYSLLVGFSPEHFFLYFTKIFNRRKNSEFLSGQYYIYSLEQLLTFYEDVYPYRRSSFVKNEKRMNAMKKSFLEFQHSLPSDCTFMRTYFTRERNGIAFDYNLAKIYYKMEESTSKLNAAIDELVNFVINEVSVYDDFTKKQISLLDEKKDEYITKMKRFTEEDIYISRDVIVELGANLDTSTRDVEFERMCQNFFSSNNY